MSESELGKKIQLAWTTIGHRLFRNNVGMGWTGAITKFPTAKTITIYPQDVLIRNARPLHSGLIKGSGDYIGWREVIITEDMVGKKIAQFASVEIKQPKGRVTSEQLDWVAAVSASGGYARIARTVEESL